MFIRQLAKLQIGLGSYIPFFPFADSPGGTGTPPLPDKARHFTPGGLSGQFGAVGGLYPDIFLFGLINFPVGKPPRLSLYRLPHRFNRAGALFRLLLCLFLLRRIQLGSRPFGTVC